VTYYFTKEENGGIEEKLNKKEKIRDFYILLNFISFIYSNK
jgi:hypothetical protein